MDRRTDAITPATRPVPSEYRTPMMSRWALERIEIHVMDLVADLLDRGWEPEALVDEVDELARRGPHAGEVVTLALVSHAGYWMNDPTMIHLLDEVDELAAGFHHLVGLTVPGWLSEYAHGAVTCRAALDGVADILEILPALPCLSAARTNPEGAAWNAWRRHRP